MEMKIVKQQVSIPYKQVQNILKLLKDDHTERKPVVYHLSLISLFTLSPS